MVRAGRMSRLFSESVMMSTSDPISFIHRWKARGEGDWDEEYGLARMTWLVLTWHRLATSWKERC